MRLNDDITGDDDDYVMQGYRMVKFVGGSLDGERRMIREPVEDGHTYSRLVPTEQRWHYVAARDRFVLL